MLILWLCNNALWVVLFILLFGLFYRLIRGGKDLRSDSQDLSRSCEDVSRRLFGVYKCKCGCEHWLILHGKIRCVDCESEYRYFGALPEKFNELIEHYKIRF